MLFVFLLVIVTGCSLETTTLPQFYEEDVKNVSKIVILDGSTGAQKTIEDKKAIDDFLNSIKDIQFIPDENQEPRDGFTYAITLHQDGKNPFTFGPTYVNDHYYHTEPDILPIIDDFYTNLELKVE
ncbi:MAG: hypothetical protein ACI33P_04920 [Lysinibacillus sp.]